MQDLLPDSSIGLPVAALAAATCLRASLAAELRRAEGPSAGLRLASETMDSLIAAMAVVFLIVRPFMAQAFFIPSSSMAPTLVPSDRILVNKLAYRLGEPKRNEVAVFRAPPEADPSGRREERDFVKRVVGLPGDVIEVRGGVTYVNGRPDHAPGAEPPDYELDPFVVPPGTLFVMGDNRGHSNDSHWWGPLEKSRLVGKAVAIFWPPERAGAIQ